MTWGMSKSLDQAATTWPMAKRVERQARLMGEMMERVGADSGVAAREGRGISLAAASRRCLLCGNFGACRRWLDEGGDTVAPEFCANAAYFDRVRASASQ